MYVVVDMDKMIRIDTTNNVSITELPFFSSYSLTRLNTTSEEKLSEFLSHYAEADCFVVYIKYKYDYEKDYTYSAEPCIMCRDGIMWLNDWWKVQQDVEYISVMVIGDQL